MFGRDKVLTYNPKDYENQLSEGQKNDLKSMGVYDSKKSILSGKNTINKPVINYNLNGTKSAGEIFNKINDFINKFLDNIIEKINNEIKIRKGGSEGRYDEIIKSRESLISIISQIKNTSSKAKTITLTIIVIFLIIYTRFLIIPIAFYGWILYTGFIESNKNKKSGEYKKSEDENQNGNNSFN